METDATYMRNLEERVSGFEEGTCEVGKDVELSATASRYYGSGDWDKIPYTIRVTTHVLLTVVAADVPEALLACEEYVLASTVAALKEGKVICLDTITNDLYPDLFDKGD